MAAAGKLLGIRLAMVSCRSAAHVLYLDSDAIVVDPSLRVEDFLALHTGPAMAYRAEHTWDGCCFWRILAADSMAGAADVKLAVPCDAPFYPHKATTSFILYL